MDTEKENVVKVEPDGTIVPVGVGTATITVTVDDEEL